MIWILILRSFHVRSLLWLSDNGTDELLMVVKRWKRNLGLMVDSFWMKKLGYLQTQLTKSCNLMVSISIKFQENVDKLKILVILLYQYYLTILMTYCASLAVLIFLVVLLILIRNLIYNGRLFKIQLLKLATSCLMSSFLIFSELF